MRRNLSRPANVMFWLMALLLCWSQAHAQGPGSTGNITIEGIVIDNNTNEPVVGATVKLKDGTKGTVTSADGKFVMTGLSVGNVVHVSFIGFKPRQFTVGKKRFVTVYLEDDANQLDQVVVTGFQKLKKNSFTGTATVVTGDELRKVNVKDAVKALEAFDPSFRIIDRGGFGSDPNHINEINIRGASNIQRQEFDANGQALERRTNLLGNPNMPIFMLDGFEVPVQKIYDMDINRIQSMTILKDAAATALYGSRAANGVVVVTSVPPKVGEIRIDYNTTLELTFPDLSDYNLTNAAEKLQVERDAGIYTAKENWQKEEKEILYNNRLNEIRRGVNTDWLARPLRNVMNWRNSVMLSGGVNSMRYELAFNYDNNRGVMKGSYRNRWGGGLKIDYRLREWLQIQDNVTINRTSYEDSPFGSFSNYGTYLPYDAIYGENGEYLQKLPQSGQVNPLWQQQQLESYNGRGTITDITNNLGVNVYFTPTFYLRGAFGISQVQTNDDSFIDPKHPSFKGRVENKRGELSISKNSDLKWNLNATLHFNQRFKKHFVNLTSGVEAIETISHPIAYKYQGFSLGSQNKPSYSASQDGVTKDTEIKVRTFGLLAALNYTYDEIYLLDASFRLDGSSQFGVERRFAPFASIGVGVNMHNYDFIKRMPWINSLRLKGTYGSTGKVTFTRFDVISSYGHAPSWYYTGPGYLLATFGNPDLSWELTKTLDLGFSLELFKRRFFLEATYYHKATDRMIDKVKVRPSSGFDSYSGNVGGVLNEGIELKTNVTVFRNRDWAVVLNANLAHNKNTITKLNPAMEEYNKKIRDNYSSESSGRVSTLPPLLYYVGASTSAIYAVPSLGIDPATGTEFFRKLDGTVTQVWDKNDMVVCGDFNPDVQGTFGINVAWRGIYLNAGFKYAYGGQAYNNTLVSKVENANIEKENVDRRVLTDRWYRVGDVSQFYGIRERGLTNRSSRFVQNDNFVSFNSLSIGYDFNKRITSLFKLNALSVVFNAADLGRWSTIKVERGLSYPYAHTYSLTLRASY